MSLLRMRPRDKSLRSTCSVQNATTDMQPAILAGRSRDSCCNDVRCAVLGSLRCCCNCIFQRIDDPYRNHRKGTVGGGECSNVQLMGSDRKIDSSLTCGSTCPQEHWSCAPCSRLGVPTDPDPLLMLCPSCHAPCPATACMKFAGMLCKAWRVCC